MTLLTRIKKSFRRKAKAPVVQAPSSGTKEVAASFSTPQSISKNESALLPKPPSSSIQEVIPAIKTPSDNAVVVPPFFKSSSNITEGDKLPAELLILCLLPLRPVDLEVDGTPFLLPSSVEPNLCNAARVCRFWAACAQTVLFKNVHINKRAKRILFSHAIDPNTQRGRSLGELVANLTLHYDYSSIRPSDEARIKTLLGYDPDPSSSTAGEIVQRCPSLRAFRIVHHENSASSSETEFRVPSPLTMSPSLDHLIISLIIHRDNGGPPNYAATMEVYRLIASSPSITSMRLDTWFDARYSPPIPPVSWLSPSFKLHTLLARRIDQLTLWALHYSKDSLKSLALVFTTTTTLRQVGKDFPNVTTLELELLKTGDTLEEFHNLDTLIWTAFNARDTSLLSKLPKSTRCIKFRTMDLGPALRALARSGTLPNLRNIIYQRKVRVSRYSLTVVNFEDAFNLLD